MQVLLARGTKNQTLQTMRVVGIFNGFPGFPQGADLVTNLAFYQAMTRLPEVDFFLARATDHGASGLSRATTSISEATGAQDPMNVESTATTLNKDQSSLTALNVHGLADLTSAYTLLMIVTGLSIFVFGVMLQRRREYVTMRAHGASGGHLRAVVVAEVSLVTLSGVASGLLVGVSTAQLLVRVLHPLFILRPSTALPAGRLAVAVALTLASGLACALVATAMALRQRPSEVLREA